MNEIVFLGTGGGRFVTITQFRSTGGFRINLENLKLHVDPGPGALTRTRQFGENPQSINCLFVSHAHPDHSTEANVIVEAMTKGMTRERGYLIGSKSVMEGTEDLDKVITRYHKEMPKENHTVKAGDKLEIERIKFEFTESNHRDPTTIGFKMNTGDKIISYITDTGYFPELANLHKGSDIILMNLLRPANDRISHHLCTQDAIKLLKETKPKLAVIKHFGMKMLRANPIEEAKTLSQESGIRVISAEDGMKISLDEADQTTLGAFDE